MSLKNRRQVKKESEKRTLQEKKKDFFVYGMAELRFVFHVLILMPCITFNLPDILSTFALMVL